MRLRMRDQLHISSVSNNTLTAGQEIDVSKALGEELLKKHPDKVEVVDAGEAAPATKTEPAPDNKKEPKPKNKSSAKAASKKKRRAA